MKAVLYISVSTDVMLTSNFWTEVGLHNGAKVKVVDFVYMDYGGPRNGGVSEAVVVQFRNLAKSTHIENFLEGY